MASPEDKRLSEVVEWMQTPNFYPHRVESVRLCETHISMVFLTGDVVYKIKKPVDMEFLYSTFLLERAEAGGVLVGLDRQSSRELPADQHVIVAERALRQATVQGLPTLALGHHVVEVIEPSPFDLVDVVDPLPQMAQLAREFDIWFHVDGAYGGWGMLDERVEATIAAASVDQR